MGLIKAGLLLFAFAKFLDVVLVIIEMIEEIKENETWTWKKKSDC